MKKDNNVQTRKGHGNREIEKKSQNPSEEDVFEKL